MKKQTFTPAQIRSAKIQQMEPEKFVSGINSLKASLIRGKQLVK